MSCPGTAEAVAAGERAPGGNGATAREKAPTADLSCTAHAAQSVRLLRELVQGSFPFWRKAFWKT